MIKVLLAAAALAGAQTPAPQSFEQKADEFTESMDFERRGQLAEELGRVPIVSARDVAKATDLLTRFGDDEVRNAVVSAIELMAPDARHLEPAFLTLLKERDPEPLLVGIRGAARLKSHAAVPELRRLVKKKFEKPEPEQLALPGERAAWWTQYEALQALARIEGDRAFGLIAKKCRQAPPVARIMAVWYWEKTLPLIARWSESSGADRRRAEVALTAPVPTPALRATRETMLAHVRNPKADRELRHQLALKVGFASTEPEVAELVAEYEKTSDEDTRLMLAAAVFASRSRAAVPLLVRFMKENSQARLREGARDQLRDTLPAEEYRPLLEWAAKNDPDPGVRQRAGEELRRSR